MPTEGNYKVKVTVGDATVESIGKRKASSK